MEDELNSSFKTNVIGNMHLFSLAMPLVLKGSAKKVIATSSGLADLDLISKYDVAYSVPYVISS
jgi:short-subunit dehydrogenase involved in D-alanine esterification of teichoic acids